MLLGVYVNSGPGCIAAMTPRTLLQRSLSDRFDEPYVKGRPVGLGRKRLKQLDRTSQLFRIHVDVSLRG
jgi:hypothetical protein